MTALYMLGFEQQPSLRHNDLCGLSEGLEEKLVVGIGRQAKRIGLWGSSTVLIRAMIVAAVPECHELTNVRYSIDAYSRPKPLST